MVKKPVSAPGAAASTPVKQTPSSSTANLKNANDAQAIVAGIWQNYLDQTPQRVKLIDTFMAFLVAVGALQFVYCVLAGNYVCCSQRMELLRWKMAAVEGGYFEWTLC